LQLKNSLFEEYRMEQKEASFFYAYMLRCADETLYSGYTTDLKRRVAAHNSGTGAKYTRSRRPVELVWVEKYSTKHEAMQREAALKKLKRADKLRLLEQASTYAADKINLGGENTMELLDIVDEDGLPTGETVERELAHRNGIRHRTSHVWILRKQNNTIQVLLQKRSKNKDSYPGCYDISSAGHIPCGEDYINSALRELQEELGITATAEELRETRRAFSTVAAAILNFMEIFTGKAFGTSRLVTFIFYGELGTNHNFSCRNLR